MKSEEDIRGNYLKPFEKRCSVCKSTKTYITKNGYEQWHKINNEYVCRKCYFRIKVNPRALKFRHRMLLLEFEPRQHICTNCGNKIGDYYVNSVGKTVKTKRTAIHHKKYEDGQPLKHTKEVCASCHAKAEWTPERKLAHSERIKELWRNGKYG